MHVPNGPASRIDDEKREGIIRDSNKLNNKQLTSKYQVSKSTVYKIKAELRAQNRAIPDEG